MTWIRGPFMKTNIWNDTDKLRTIYITHECTLLLFFHLWFSVSSLLSGLNTPAIGATDEPGAGNKPRHLLPPNSGFLSLGLFMPRKIFPPNQMYPAARCLSLPSPCVEYGSAPAVYQLLASSLPWSVPVWELFQMTPDPVLLLQYQ